VPYVTSAAILTHVGRGAGTAEEQAWAGKCADAVEGLIAHRLAGVTPSAGQIDMLEKAALQDGAAAFTGKDAPHGIQSMGPDGAAVRLGAKLGRELEPVFLTIAGPGIG
jgi:hypothetical protein